jgi:type II secretion system protein G
MIMAVAGALLVGRSNKPKSAKKNPISRSILELRALKIASDRFYYDTLRYPTEEENLEALVNDPGVNSWKGPYVNLVKPDPWHNKYIYILSNDTVTVFSSGPDGIPGNNDDIYPYEE